jgi:hypothetical protein
MRDTTRYMLFAIFAWLAFIGSMILFYLIVQASHPKTSPQERAYQACLYNTDSKNTDKCKYLEPSNE